MENVTLESLVGQHLLSGVDTVTEPSKQECQSDMCEVINFILDGVTYTATEDPSDGYRSCMDSLIVSNAKLENMFEPIEVIGIYRDKGDYGSVADVLELRDVVNGKIVLEVGTDNTDDYYPLFVGCFSPQNMSINETTDTNATTLVGDPQTEVNDINQMKVFAAQLKISVLENETVETVTKALEDALAADPWAVEVVEVVSVETVSQDRMDVVLS